MLNLAAKPSVARRESYGQPTSHLKPLNQKLNNIQSRMRNFGSFKGSVVCSVKGFGVWLSWLENQPNDLRLWGLFGRAFLTCLGPPKITYLFS